MKELLLNAELEASAQTNTNSRSYFCTWQAQNDVAGMNLDRFPLKARAMSASGKACEKLAVNMLDEDILFGEGGFASQFPCERSELYFMLDYGWDVPYITDPAENMVRFGGLELNTDRFPSFTGTPAERLKKLNDKIKECGWRGLCIWVPSQPEGTNYDVPFTPDVIDYWRERILWCREADVRYWKLDLGAYMHNPEFRKLLTELGRKLDPALCIEQTICPAALNGSIEADGRFADEENAPKFAQTYECCDLFRSGDVSVELGNVTSLDRIAYLLKSPGAEINCECNPLLAASLGMTMGIMRSALHKGGSENGEKLGEITAAVRWHRFAPPFADGSAIASDRMLAAQHTYGETWVPNASNKTVTQSAPAMFSRNTRLPDILTGEDSRYVTASQNPSGAYSIASVPRPMADGTSLPAPTVLCYPDESTEMIGVFGDFEELHICLDGQKAPTRVLAQSMIEGDAKDITKEVVFDGHALIIKGETLARLDPKLDRSDNAVAIKLIK